MWEAIKQAASLDPRKRIELFRRTGELVPLAQTPSQSILAQRDATLRAQQRQRDFEEEHPEFIQPDPAKLRQGLESDIAGIEKAKTAIPEFLLGQIQQAAGLPPLNPDKPVPSVMDLLNFGTPSSQQGGLLEGRSGPGQVPTSTTAVPIIPDPELSKSNIKPTIKEEGGPGAVEKVAEFLVGTAPVAAVKAAIDTPGGALKNPSLALNRARGRYVQLYQQSPILVSGETMLAVAGAGEAANLTAKAVGTTARISKNLVKDLRLDRAFRNTEGFVDDFLERAGQEADDVVTARIAEQEALRANQAEFERLKAILVSNTDKMAKEAARLRLPRILKEINAAKQRIWTDPVSSFARVGVPGDPQFSKLALPAPPGTRIPTVLRAENITNIGPNVDFVMTHSPRSLTTQAIKPEQIRINVGGKTRLKGVTQETPIPKGAKIARPEGPTAMTEALDQRAAIARVADDTPMLTKAGNVADNAVPPSATIVVPEAGPAVFKSGTLQDLFVRVKNRAKHPIARAIVRSVENAFVDHHQLAGRYLESLRDLSVKLPDGTRVKGLHKVGLNDRIDILSELNGINTGNTAAVSMANQVKPLFKRVEQQLLALQRIGKPVMVRMPDGSMRPWSPRQDFGAPRYLLPEVTDVLWKDARSAFKKARNAIGDKKLTDEEIGKILGNMHEKGLLKQSATTQRAIDALVAGHWAQNPGEAWAYLARRSYDEKFGFFGHIDAHRSAHLPADFYEIDAGKVLTEYFYGASKRIAEARHLGGRGEVVQDLLKALDLASPEEAKFFTKVVDNFVGETNYQFAQKNPTLKALYDGYTQFSVASKIGLGFATIPNLTQFAISTIPILGFENFAKGALRAVFSPTYRSQLRRAGPVVRETIQKFVTEEFGGATGHATNLLMKPFVGANKMQKYFAAAAMDVGYDDLARIAGDALHPKNAMANRFFRKLGLTPQQVGTAKGRQRAIFKFASETQLQRSVLDDPFLFNQPGWRTFLLFKSFGVKQAQLINDFVLKEAGRGNIGPFLRLGAAGALGGPLVSESKDELRKCLSGQPNYQPPRGLMMKLAQGFGDLGSLGVFTDLMRFDGILPEDQFVEMIGNGLFAATPLPLSDFGKFSFNVAAGTKDIARRGLKSGGRRAFARAIKDAGGSVTTALAERVKSQAQIQAEVQRRQRDRQNEVNRLVIRGDWESAVEVARAWNKIYAKDGTGFMVSLPDVDRQIELRINDIGRREDYTKEQVDAIKKLLSTSKDR
jgi:hypothetical protein